MTTKTVIGIDRGASFTDFAVVNGSQLVDHLSIETRQWDKIEKSLKHIREKHPTEHLAFSGAATGMPSNMEALVYGVPEIEAIGLGGAAMTGCRTCLVISLGTGSAFVHVDNNQVRHVGGTGVGGGTIRGLASLMCGMNDPKAVEELALKGNSAQMNLTIGDLGLGDLSFLPAHATVSNFANIKSRKVEDKAAGILSLVAETIGIIASVCAREAGCSDHIVAVGKVAGNEYIADILNRVGELYQTRFLHPEHPGCATAFGAAVCYVKHQVD